MLDPDGTHLHPGIGEVSLRSAALYEGHVVPHLVVRMPQGPVTVLLLRHRNVGEPVRVSEQGYVGVVLPAPRGSIAIVGTTRMTWTASRGRFLMRWTGAADATGTAWPSKENEEMSNRVMSKPVALAIGAALVTSLATAGAAHASSFTVNALASGYMLAAGDSAGDEKAKEGKCGEGKCGGDKKAEGKCGEGKCGEGKCGGDKKAEGKCGEGKCGSDKKAEEEKPQG